MADAIAVGFDDYLEGDDLVAGGEQTNDAPIPHRIAGARGMILFVALNLVAVADGPHPTHIRLRIAAQQQEGEDED